MAETLAVPRFSVERPYDEPTNAEEVWAGIPPRRVRVADLVPTQSRLMVDRLVAQLHGEPPDGWDPVPHVVEVDGVLHVHDGHHRWARAAVAGEEWLEVRVLPLERRRG